MNKLKVNLIEILGLLIFIVLAILMLFVIIKLGIILTDFLDSYSPNTLGLNDMMAGTIIGIPIMLFLLYLSRK